jgi:hypothetical protein
MAMPAFDPFDDDEQDDGDVLLVDEIIRLRAEGRVCSHCGCTDEDACIGSDGLPCHWVTPTLCSACLEV